MKPPVLLLDVDGVVNALDPPWPEVSRSKCVGLTIRWAPKVVRRLAALHTSGAVRVRWCTTWCGYADQLAALQVLFGVRFPSAFTSRPLSKTWGDMKVEAALAVLAEGRRLIWVDDCEVAGARELYSAVVDAERTGIALLVAPEPELGLTTEHLDAIEAFAGVGAVAR